MKCKSCGQTCFAKAELSGTGYKSASLCCGAEIDYTEDYSKDQWQGYRHYGDFTTSGVTGYPKEFKTLRDEIAIEAMKLIFTFPDNENWSYNKIIEDSFKMADIFLEQRNK